MALGDPYITDDGLAAYLKVTKSGNEEFLDLACRSTTRWVDGYCRRQFNLATAASARYFDVLRDGIVLVDDIGDETIAVATDTSSDGTFATSWTVSDFQATPLDALDQGRPVTSLGAVGDFSFPRSTSRRGLVRVTAKWGWPAVPDDVLEACYIQAARVYKRRESAEGVLGNADFGLVRVGSRLDPDVEQMLTDLKLPARIA